RAIASLVGSPHSFSRGPPTFSAAAPTRSAIRFASHARADPSSLSIVAAAHGLLPSIAPHTSRAAPTAPQGATAFRQQSRRWGSCTETACGPPPDCYSANSTQTGASQMILQAAAHARASSPLRRAFHPLLLGKHPNISKQVFHL